jgi:uncharacterized membrane protein YedE/YeeE
MFSSFGKTVIWVFIVSIPVFLLFPAHASRVDGWAVSRMAMLGGFLFGVGAALNGGCAFSTIGRLCEGKMRMLLTLVGFLGGVGQSLILMADGQMSAAARASPLINLTGMPIVGVLAICSGWALWELFRLWRTRPRQLPMPRSCISASKCCSVIKAQALGSTPWNLFSKESHLPSITFEEKPA